MANVKPTKSNSTNKIRRRGVLASRYKHGATSQNGRMTPEYSAWAAIKRRCYNPNQNRWKYYGGRGIIVCDRWLHSFENFLADMGVKPSPKHTIDRIDSNGNYEPANCRWATPQEQNLNYSRNRILEYQGKSQTLKEWGIEVGLPPTVISKRLKRGWNMQDALFGPLQNTNKHRLETVEVAV